MWCSVYSLDIQVLVVAVEAHAVKGLDYGACVLHANFAICQCLFCTGSLISKITEIKLHSRWFGAVERHGE